MTTGQFTSIDTLSGLLNVAIEDGWSALDTPMMEFDSTDWIRQHGEGGTCTVCLAGAVMAQSLGALRREPLPEPWNYSAPVCQRLQAIDQLRTGSVVNAYHDMVEPNAVLIPFAVLQKLHAIQRQWRAERHFPSFLSHAQFERTLTDMADLRDRLAAENL